ncbi:uncharacterized [Tachysurus ichikawai]
MLGARRDTGEHAARFLLTPYAHKAGYAGAGTKHTTLTLIFLYSPEILRVSLHANERSLFQGLRTREILYAQLSGRGIENCCSFRARA